MSMHAMKTEATATAIPVASPTMAAPVVTMKPKSAPRS
jgi:nitrate/nitrite transport system permease protein